MYGFYKIINTFVERVETFRLYLFELIGTQRNIRGNAVNNNG